MAISSAVRKITVLKHGPDGQVSALEIYKSDDKKPKSTKALSPVEKMVRMAADVNATIGNDYLARHKKSRRKKKDGWLLDAAGNAMRSSLKGMKRVKITKLM